MNRVEQSVAISVNYKLCELNWQLATGCKRASTPDILSLSGVDDASVCRLHVDRKIRYA